MQLYINRPIFGTHRTASYKVPTIETECPRFYSATGYGLKIPTPYKVQYGGRWYRVYSKCVSNVSSEYIMVTEYKQKIQLNVTDFARGYLI